MSCVAWGVCLSSFALPCFAQELIESKSALYTQMDRTWKIEVALASALAGDGCIAMMGDRVLKSLPTAAVSVSMKTCKQKLDELSESTFLQGLHEGRADQVRRRSRDRHGRVAGNGAEMAAHVIEHVDEGRRRAVGRAK